MVLGQTAYFQGQTAIVSGRVLSTICGLDVLLVQVMFDPFDWVISMVENSTPPPKWTWNLKSPLSKRNIIFRTFIFGWFHDSMWVFLGGSDLFWCKLHSYWPSMTTWSFLEGLWNSTLPAGRCWDHDLVGHFLIRLETLRFLRPAIIAPRKGEQPEGAV